ncbi:DHH family phosphoesterase [Thermodesulforhabdus norvegica]|uniref:DHHA1 domain-containing protein n=1 Tax=Thermodesulforhabdus norvegica TaxID=39841 RepID=A0A1I4R9N3_9BACT|nr:DHH family phosphoesterase [Thermodesulforhabdus norvegica]SFM49018.1 DHHA1 domain-containing protein [Thermodesulforhabdus norvegica]
MDALSLRNRNDRLRTLLSFFRPDDNVLIVIDPDPDALGSAWALKRILWRRVASTVIAIIRPVKRWNNISMIRLLRIPLTPLENVPVGSFSKFVLVDGQPHHNPVFGSFRFDVVIDHHPLPPEKPASDNDTFYDVRPQYGATSTILTEYLKTAKITPSRSLATALLYGIKTDTRNFERHTREEDIRCFLYLYPKVNHSVLSKIEISDLAVEDLVFFERALKSKIISDQKILVYLGEVPSSDILVIVSEFFLKIHNISWSIAAGKVQDRLIVVARSDGYRKNAGKTLQRCFGSMGPAGGHASMARAEVPLEALRTRLHRKRLTRTCIESFLKKNLL